MIVDVIIGSAESRSDPIFLGNKSMTAFLQRLGLETPSPFHFHVSYDGSSWHLLTQNGSPVIIPSQEAHFASGGELSRPFIPIDPVLTRPFQYIRVVGGIPGTEINVSASQGYIALVVEDVPGGGSNILTPPMKRITTISASSSQTDPIYIYGYVPVALLMPPAWTAAPITFQLRFTPDPAGNPPFLPLYDEAGEYVIASATAGVHIALQHCLFLGSHELVVRSGTAAQPVLQTSQRTLDLILKVL